MGAAAAAHVEPAAGDALAAVKQARDLARRLAAFIHRGRIHEQLVLTGYGQYGSGCRSERGMHVTATDAPAVGRCQSRPGVLPTECGVCSFETFHDTLDAALLASPSRSYVLRAALVESTRCLDSMCRRARPS